MQHAEINGKQIKAAATLAGFSLTELADKLGLSRSTLYAYVSGVLQPPKQRIKQIASLTGTSVDYFRQSGPAGNAPDDTLQLVDAVLSSANAAAAIPLIQTRLDRLSDKDRANTMLRLGNTLVIDGQYQEAIDWLIRARELFDKLKDPHSSGRCSQTLGFCYANIGPLRRAQACFEEAGTRLNPDARWKAQSALAVVAERRGDCEWGLALIKDVEAKFHDPAVALYVRGIRANILTTMGQWQAVYDLEIEALELAEKMDAKDQIGERLISLVFASIYTGRADTEARIAQASGYFQAHSDKARKAFYSTALSLYWLWKGDYAKAQRDAERALESAIKGRFRRVEIAAYLRLAETSLLMGRMKEALNYARQATAYAESYEYAGERDYAQSLTAFLAAQSEDKALAKEHLEALQARDTWHAVSPALELTEAANALLEGTTWNCDEAAKGLQSKGICFIPAFQTAAVSTETHV